jgi:hypothetical protein
MSTVYNEIAIPKGVSVGAGAAEWALRRQQCGNGVGRTREEECFCSPDATAGTAKRAI